MRILLILLALTGCSTVEIAPDITQYMEYTPSELRQEHQARHGFDPGPIAGFVDFEKRDTGWHCLVFTEFYKNQDSEHKACTLKHEIEWHCQPGLAHAQGYGDKATRGSIKMAASTHPKFGPDGRKYRDCGRG